jgi:hypothetical protein
MEKLNIKDDWNFVCQFFPDNLDALAKQTGAASRWRNIKNASDLMRVILAYVVDDLSLRSVAGWAALADVGELKDTSVLHRLRNAGTFLEAVLAHLLSFRIRGEAADGSPLRINDASVISIPGSKGTDWRIHAIYNPVSTRLIRVEITDAHGGEKLERNGGQAGEVIIGDRVLAHASGIHAVAKTGAYTLLRMHWQNIRIEDAQARGVELEDVLRRADAGDTGTIVYVPLEGAFPIPARLLVRPLPAVQAEKARRKMHRNAAKKGRTPSALALRLAGYFCLLTTLTVEMASDAVVLELYRIRWQIELFFKRCKSLLHLGQLRADDPRLVRAYCTAKLIEVALIELLASEGESFSPWGIPRVRLSASLLVAESAPPAH